MSDPHPNDQVVLVAYPDATFRLTYPPLPRTMGNPNAVASEGVLSTMVAKLPTPLPEPPAPALPMEVLNDPEAAPYLTAGWLSP